MRAQSVRVDVHRPLDVGRSPRRRGQRRHGTHEGRAGSGHDDVGASGQRHRSGRGQEHDVVDGAHKERPRSSRRARDPTHRDAVDDDVRTDVVAGRVGLPGADDAD